MMKVEGQQVELENRGAECAEGVGFGEGVSPPNDGGVWRGGCAPSPETFLNFMSRYAAFGCNLMHFQT